MQSRRPGVRSGRARCAAPAVYARARLERLLRDLNAVVAGVEENLEGLSDDERVDVLALIDELKPGLDAFLESGIAAGHIEAPDWWEDRSRGGSPDA